MNSVLKHVDGVECLKRLEVNCCLKPHVTILKIDG